MTLERAYWTAKAAGIFRPRIKLTEFVPQSLSLPPRMPEVNSAWKGIESVLGDLLTRFEVPRHDCLEFGVEHGYSTAAFASFFENVTGVDTFTGDIHTNVFGDFYAATTQRLSVFPNVKLIRGDYRDWIASDSKRYDLIHVDIVHTYVDTYACGLWAAMHSRCTLFHDTESFPAVKQALIDISRNTGKRVYNYREHYGLGILV
jgi:hypothetical protein